MGGSLTFLTEALLKEKIKTSSVGGAYVFAGEEDYLKKYYLKSIKDLCCPDDAFDIFNHAVFDGEDIDVPALEEAVESAPMMSDFKLIEWRYRPTVVLTSL